MAEETKRRWVNIVALGASRDDYIVSRMMYTPEHDGAWDEVWAINAMGGVIRCDRVIHMDPISASLDDVRWKRLYDKLRDWGVPVVTAYPHPDYPNSVAYPLHEVVKATTGSMAYFNTTVAYAVALAIYEGFTDISLSGCDFTYPEKHAAESGRGCTEFWLAVAALKGIHIHIAPRSNLMDTNEFRRLYGYNDDVNRHSGADNPCLTYDGVIERHKQVAEGAQVLPFRREPVAQPEPVAMGEAAE